MVVVEQRLEGAVFLCTEEGRGVLCYNKSYKPEGGFDVTVEASLGMIEGRMDRLRLTSQFRNQSILY